MLDAYAYALTNVTLWGPTNFADIIKVTHSFAEKVSRGRGYYTLLILTDGVVTDLEETIDAIIAASGPHPRSTRVAFWAPTCRSESRFSLQE